MVIKLRVEQEEKLEITEFLKYGVYEELIDAESFVEIFNVDYIKELEATDLACKSIEWLSYFFSTQFHEVLELIDEFDSVKQADIFDIWFSLICSRDELESLSRAIIHFKLGLPIWPSLTFTM